MPMPISRLRLFLFVLPSSLAVWSAICAVQRAVWPGRPVFASLYRMYTYHDVHAYAFIAVVAVVFALSAAAVGPAVGRLTGWRRRFAILGVLVASVTLAGVPGGALWVVYDTLAGFVPSRPILQSNLLRGAGDGLVVGWLVVAVSVPFNVLAAASGCGLLEAGLRLARVRLRASTAPPGA